MGAKPDSGGGPVRVPERGRASAQESRKTVILEVYLPEGARLFIEGQETKSKAPMCRFESPPLPPGKYNYTIKAIIPGADGPRTVERRIDVRPATSNRSTSANRANVP